MVQAITADDVDRARRLALREGRRLQLSPDDAVGVANLALVEAAHNHDPLKGAKFSSFAYHRICGALLDQYYADRGAYRLGKNGRVRVVPPAAMNIEDALIACPIEFVDASLQPEAVVVLREALLTLSDRERAVLKKYLVDGLIAKEIAEEMGLTESRVCQIVREMRHKLEMPS